VRAYKPLSKQTFCYNEYQIVPIRDEDKYDIMKWRNEQIYHLRQSNPLDKKMQDNYFNNVITKLFNKDEPNQILFSYLENGICIGYGGLVHINWIDKNAEISFVIKTELEKKHFKKHWDIYLNLIENVAFNELNFNKIYTYAFDFRPKLYKILESNNFSKEAILRNHIKVQNNFFDIVIHSKFNNN